MENGKFSGKRVISNNAKVQIGISIRYPKIEKEKSSDEDAIMPEIDRKNSICSMAQKLVEELEKDNKFFKTLMMYPEFQKVNWGPTPTRNAL